MSDDAIVVFMTAANGEEATRLADMLVGAHLAACVQILPGMISVYVWEGKVQRENEHLMLIKTLPDKYAELEKFITANHSYTTPEIVAVESSEVAEPYRQWLEEILTK